MSNTLWISDFAWRDGAVLVKKTGHRVAISFEILHEVFVWLCFYIAAQKMRLARLLSGKPRATIAFTPDKPRPWYLIWPVIHAAGVRISDDPSAADIVMHFEDVTHAEESSAPPPTKPGALCLNFNCADISKSRIAEAWAEIAGYDLSVDPETHTGLMVDKSEINAAHDGQILQGPTPAEPGRAYQKLIDNEIRPGLVEDLRTPTLNGEILVVYKKRRPLERRFMNENTEVEFCAAEDVFTEAERDLVRRFTKAINLDWGGVDILRDAEDGRIYIVDANKTDMGPPIALPLRQKLKSVRLLARAFLQEFAPSGRQD